MALIEADLNSPSGLREAIEAGNALVKAMNADLHPALVNLAAVQEQRKRYDKWRIKFSQSICRYLNNLFIHEVIKTLNLKQLIALIC
jgi:exocyst complex component 1